MIGGGETRALGQAWKKATEGECKGGRDSHTVELAFCWNEKLAIRSPDRFCCGTLWRQFYESTSYILVMTQERYLTQERYIQNGYPRCSNKMPLQKAKKTTLLVVNKRTC